ncbi:MAG TPA: hypothetical protein VLJ83_08415 [Gemmatimonadaceae bacterium]|nr:hypothetical protein [Gemmatimonadaceae bacterium]
MRARHLLYPLIVVAFTGCDLLGGKCTYELRTLDASGKITDSGTDVAAATLTLSEQRGSLQGQSVSWLITGSAKGHVLSASFKDSTDPAHVLLDLPIASADRPEISQGAASSSTGVALAGFHTILAAGHGVIELQTDFAGQLTIQIPMIADNDTDWIRPNCS